MERKIGTAGMPHFFTDVRVVDVDNIETKPGERGEIQIKGPNVMREYWNRPDATEAAFTEDGYVQLRRRRRPRRGGLHQDRRPSQGHE